MLYFKNYKLKNSFNLPCIVDEIWFPENNHELSCIYKTIKEATIVADCTNVICKPNIKRVISLKKLPNEIYAMHDESNVYLRVDANVKTHTLVQYSLDNNFSGLEGLFGLPGRVGSAIYGNSGSGQYCISDYLEYVITINQHSYSGDVYSKESLLFDRRYCVLHKTKDIITEARFKFPRKPVDKKLLEKVKEHRMRIPLCSSGGIWKNWHVLKPYSKQLIGLRVGGMFVSEMVNVICNDGSGTYENVKELIVKIRHIVKEPLELEVKIV